MSRIKRNKRTEKRHGEAADAPRRSSRRKHQKKKLECKLRTVRFFCTICRNTLSGKRFALQCSHSFHIKCIKRWLEKEPRTCPNCRGRVLPNTGLFQLHNPASQTFLTLNIQRILASMLGDTDDIRHPPIPPSPIQDFVNPRD